MAYAESNGVRLYYEEAGQGFPIVFAHEFSSDWRAWEGQLRHFSRRYRCIAYNARGFPPSDAPQDLEAYSQDLFVADMAGLMDALAIEQAHVVGLSLGSMTTLHFGRLHPERARSLVVAGNGPGDTRRAKQRFEAEIAEFIAAIESAGWEQVAESYGLTDDRAQLQAKNPRGCAAFARQLGARQKAGFLQTLRRVVTGRPLLADLADELRDMRVPTLIATGDEDHVCIDTCFYLKRLLPVAGLRVFPKTGHAINLEEPARFNEALEDFFAAVEEGRWPETPPDSRSSY